MLNELLQQLGHTPTQTGTTRITYKSPFNPQENTPSCFVFKNDKWDNIDPLKEFNYKDYSSGNGGDIYNFIMNYFNISFVESKKKISEILGIDYQEHNRPTPNQAPSFSFNQPKEQQNDNIKIIKTQSLQNKALIDYLLAERGISITIAKRYLGEIYYEINSKRYFGVSFMNDSGAYEIRNKYFKGCTGKDISLITPNPRDKRVKIFEGFMDFLSYLEINKNAPLSNYLILNSASMQEKGLVAIQGKFEAYELYLDNDRAGDEATHFFIGNLDNVTDKRVHYKEYKDLNEFLLPKDKLKQNLSMALKGYEDCIVIYEDRHGHQTVVNR